MIRAIIFDMDGTLYASPAVREKFKEAAYHTLASERHLSLHVAQQKIEQTRTRLMERYGSNVPYTLTLKEFNIPIEVWHSYNITFFDPRDHLSTDTILQNALAELKERYTLAIVTNNNQVQTERTLEALGIKRFFTAVFTYNSFHLLKPDPGFYAQALARLNMPGNECCVVGDRYDVDLEPAKTLGMCVYQVSGPEDIQDLLQHLDKGEE